MAFIPVPNTAQAELVYVWNDQVCQNVLHYTISQPWQASFMEEAAETLKNLWNTHLANRCSDQLSLVQVRMTDLGDETGPVVNYATGLPSPGTQTSPSLPNNCALVLTKRTQKRGRSYRGRIFHPGLTESLVTGNTVIPASAASIRDNWEELLGFDLPIAVETANMVVVSRQQNGVPLGTGIATLVTNLTTDGVVDSQRRRLPGRGS